SIIIQKSQEFLFTYFSLLNLGAVVHVVDYNLIKKEATKNINKFKSEFMIYSPKLESYALAINEMITHKTQLLSVDNITEKNYEFDKNLPAYASRDDPAVCIFTSGTTGEPKGVLLSHENIIFGGRTLKSSHGIDENDRLLLVTPFAGIAGQIFSILAPLVTGGSVIHYQEMFTSYRAFELMSKYKATWFYGIPAHYSIMINIPADTGDFNLSDMKFMRSGAAPLSLSVKESFEKIYGFPIIETMGLTEMSGQVFSNPMDAKSRRRMSVGKPVNADLKIIDENGNDAGFNKTGDILVKGQGLMMGYLDDENATKQAVKNGWLYTGDVGYVDKEDFVYIKGRKKDIAIIGGKNVSMREIEEALYSNKKINEAIAFGIPDDITGEQVVAFIKLKNNCSADEKEILDFCKNNLSDYKRPKIIRFCDSFPKSGGQGKILKFKVKKIFIERIKNG
ncbi:acyl--CoA ligase, partial [Candidatus Woesearchaeota archaeon]|nr:acyl--CoA ligase [Candidatus Woesearchaeota archaeon]